MPWLTVLAACAVCCMWGAVAAVHERIPHVLHSSAMRTLFWMLCVLVALGTAVLLVTIL